MSATLSVLREGRITGSRVAAVLGTDPYRTAEDVMREMVRQHFGDPDEFTGNWFTEWGHANEPLAIAAYMTESGNKVTKAGDQQEIVIHPQYPILAVTPDGRVGKHGLVEVKCPRKGRHRHITDRPDYLDQIQLQIACCGVDWCDFGVWTQDETPDGLIDISLVLADPEWLPANLPALEAFHERYQTIVADEELAAPYRKALVDVRTDREWGEAAYDYLDLVMLKNAIERDLEAGKAVLDKLAEGEKKTVGFGLSLTRSERKKNVNWQALLRVHAPLADPEDFRPEGKTDVVTIKPIAAA